MSWRKGRMRRISLLPTPTYWITTCIPKTLKILLLKISTLKIMILKRRRRGRRVAKVEVVTWVVHKVGNGEVICGVVSLAMVVMVMEATLLIVLMSTHVMMDAVQALTGVVATGNIVNGLTLMVGEEPVFLEIKSSLLSGY